MEKNTCANLLSKCYSTPQVDGMFGACASITELLVQSHAGEIHLLPALPKAWPSGRDHRPQGSRRIRARPSVEGLQVDGRHRPRQRGRSR